MAALLKLCSEEGSIPCKETLASAAQMLEELSELCDELTDMVGEANQHDPLD
jgi:hypothetical protein